MYSLGILCSILIGQLIHNAVALNTSYRCDSPIYCEGPLLKTVQLAHLFDDSKTFVDMPTKVPESQVLAAFDAAGGVNASADAIKKFVEDHFYEAGYELKILNTTTIPELAWIDKVEDPDYRGWLSHLNQAWKGLTFEFDLSKLCDGCVSSTLPVKNKFVVPGGRFREFYYWDSYFVIRGLLLSDQVELAKNMLENFFDFIETYGFIPNGARIYYLNRSQPPFLTQMVKAYYEKTQDADFMTRAISVLDLEYQFWLGNTTVPVKSSSGKSYKLNRYIVNNKTPRPESYLEDYNTVNDGTDFSDDVKEQMYADLATGAESGWDYSSRWLKDKVPGDGKNLLRSIETTQIVPIDLNALLWSMEDNLSEWFKTFGSAQSKKANKKKASYYKRQAKNRLVAIEKIMWNKDDYAFYDYNLTANAQRTDFTPANTFPLWLGAIPDQIKSDKKALSHVFDQTIAAIKKYPGLLTTSYYNTTQQWDFPNGWPPLTYVAMEGMLHVNDLLNDVPHVYNTTNDGTESSITGTEFSLLHVAKTLADRYTASAFCGWYRTGGSIPGVLGKLANVTSDDGHMFEKFDVTTIGVSGSQGEYVSQVGFGWTNGVAMWIFNTFGNLTAPNCNSTAISYQL